MSTDLTNRTLPDPDRPEPAKPRIDLSATQVLGGALAAMTAAFLGSRLSVAGTVVGAALASVVAAVAGNLYTASLRSTREKVRTVFQGRVGGSSMPATVTTVEGAAGSAQQAAAAGETPQWPVADAPEAPVLAAARPSRRWSVKSMVLGALAAFALAAAVLTGLELATGQALSGGHGTTISRVGEAEKPAPTKDHPKPASTAGSASASPSPSESASSTPTAPVTQSEQPSAPAPAPSTPAAAPTTSSAPSASASGTAPSPSAPQPSATGTPDADG